jgi:DNA polymerase-3 subunit epsilon
VRLRSPRPAGPSAASFARAAKVAPRTPWREAGWCALDLELTGLNERTDEIVAIGAVPIEDGRVILGEALYTLVRSEKRSAHSAVLVHKLRVADLADAPLPEEAIDRLLELLTGRVPVFHTAWVEQSFLTPALARRGVRLPAAADTEVLGRVWLRTRDGAAPERLPLAQLADRLGQQAEVPHHALGDALTTAQAFIALAGLLDAGAPQTVGTLLSAGGRLRGARRFGAT